jgi:hypothetical protein
VASERFDPESPQPRQPDQREPESSSFDPGGLTLDSFEPGSPDQDSGLARDSVEPSSFEPTNFESTTFEQASVEPASFELVERGSEDPRPDGFEPGGLELDEPILDVVPLTDVVPISDVRVISEAHVTSDVRVVPGDETDPSSGWSIEPGAPTSRPRPVRSVVGSTLTVLGVVGTVVAATLPWSGAQALPGIRGLAGGRSWLVWLLLAVVVAVVLAVVALARPNRRVRWSGAVVALVGAVLSGLAIVGLPTDRPIGVGPGLSAVTLAVLAVGQAVSAAARPSVAGWRWRSAGIAAVVAVVVLVAAGFGSAGIVNARDIDATTASGPLPVLTGSLPATANTVLWTRMARVYDVSGDAVLAGGQAQHGDTTLSGIAVLDLRTGAERWHHYERGWKVREAAIADGTALLVVDSATGTTALGFDVATGALHWRERLSASVDCTSPGQDEIAPVGACAGQFITGNGVLFTSKAGANGVVPVTYLLADSGRQWPVRLGAGCRVRGAGADPHGLYVLEQCVSAGFPQPHLLSEQVVAYDLTGRQRWSKPLAVVRGTVAGGLGPVFVRGDVVLAEQEQDWVALATTNADLLWTTTDSFVPDSVVTDGTRLVWSTGVEVDALDLHTGDPLWESSWTFPEEADLPVLAAGRLNLIRHTIGPNPYTCAEHATLLTLDPATGHLTGAGSALPDGAGNDCGPDIQDHSYLEGPLLALVTANKISVLSGN